MRRKQYKASRTKQLINKDYINSLDREQKTLYKRATRLVEQTNRRLKRLEKGIDLNRGKYNPKTKRFERKIKVAKGSKKITNYMKIKKGTFATKKLIDRLGGYYNVKQNRIVIPDKIKTPELRLIIRSALNFLSSETSTLTGISDVEERVKNSISTITEEYSELDSGDVDTLYNFFEDQDFRDVSEQIPPSDLWVMLSDAKANDLNDEEFIERIKNYVFADNPSGLDLDMKEKLERIYNKFYS